MYDALLEELDDDAVRTPEDDEGFAAQAVAVPDLTAWLMPVALCGLMLCLVAGFGRRPMALLPAGGTNSLLAVALASGFAASNNAAGLAIADHIVLLSARSSVEWNVWREATFDWTNPRRSPSSMASFPYRKTTN